MRYAYYLALAFCCGLLLACSAASPPNTALPGQPPLILISLDGFRWDFDQGAHTPNLDRIASEGVRARRLQPVFPSKTFTNHYTQVTGLWPVHHGIVANEMYDPGMQASFAMWDRDAVRTPEWWQGEPIWITAEKQGLPTAPVFWPGSEAPIQGLLPTHWSAFEYKRTDPDGIDDLLALLDAPTPERPVFLTFYTHTVDTAAHDFDPNGSPELTAAVERVDRALGQLIEGLEQRGLYDSAHLIVVSDHGMAATSPDRVIRPEEVLDPEEANIISWDPVFTAWPAPDRVEAVKQALETLPHLTVYHRDEIPERYHYRDSPRIPPIVAVADEGWSIVDSDPPEVHDSATGGSHGYDADLESMGGIFYARGPGLREGLEVDPLRSIHLYNLMCRLMGFDPAPNDGDYAVVAPMLRRSWR